MTKPNLVSNTSPLLYLGRVGQIHLLPALFEAIYVPESVVLELDAGRLLRSDTVDPRTFPWITIVTVTPSIIDQLPVNRLGIGERTAIAYARIQSGCTVALDDRQARLLANQTIPKLHHLPAALPLEGAVRIELQQGIPIFKASRWVQERVETLLRQQQTASLTPAEEEELDRYEEMDDYLSFINRTVRNLIQQAQASDTTFHASS